MTITAENVEEDPKLTGKTSVEHAENTPIATPVASYAVTDDEDDNAAVDVELSGTDADAFTLTDTNDAGGTPRMTGRGSLRSRLCLTLRVRRTWARTTRTTSR